MAEEIKDTNTEMTNEDYIQALKEMKDNSIPRDDYEKLVKEHKELLNAYVEGKDYAGAEKEQKEGPTLQEIEDKLFAEDSGLSNLEYAQLSLAHRNMVLADGGKDEYLPYGDKIVPTDEDAEAANRVAEALAYCIDYADGDSEVFTNELQRIMIDTAPMVRGKRK